jgi:hypothetical protein
VAGAQRNSPLTAGPSSRTPRRYFWPSKVPSNPSSQAAALSVSTSSAGGSPQPASCRTSIDATPTWRSTSSVWAGPSRPSTRSSTDPSTPLLLHPRREHPAERHLTPTRVRRAPGPHRGPPSPPHDLNAASSCPTSEITASGYPASSPAPNGRLLRGDGRGLRDPHRPHRAELRHRARPRHLADSATLTTFVGARTRISWPTRHELKRIPIRRPTPVYPWSLAWHTVNRHPGLEELRDHLREASTPDPGSETWTPGWARVSRPE